jgi:hypothetical protein
MVNIALGYTDVSTCPAGDPSGDQTVTVDEIIMAVNNALTGCGQSRRSRRPLALTAATLTIATGTLAVWMPNGDAATSLRVHRGPRTGG